MIIDGQETATSETQPEEVDTSAALAEISNDLFGQGTEGGESEVSTPVEGEQGTGTGGTETADAQNPAPQKAEEAGKASEGDPAKSDGTGNNSEDVQAVGAPKTWTREALADWAAIPPRAQQEIMKREEDFLRGIQGYKELADVGNRYQEVIQPFAPILAAENIDPVQMFQSFAGNHYLLSRGTEEQKIQVAANLIAHYGLDLAKLNSFIGEHVSEPADPYVKQLEDRLAALEGRTTAQIESERNAALEETNRIVSEFAKDKPHFDALSEDIAKLLEAGLAKDLPDAYEKALYANPATRQAELDRLAAEKTSAALAEENARREKIARSTGADVKTEAHERDGTVLTGSMDDTLAATLDAIRNRA